MNCRALLLLTTALAACSNVSGWSFSKGGDPPSQDEPLPSIDLPTAEHYWWNTITGKHITAVANSLAGLLRDLNRGLTGKTQWEDPNPHLATGEHVHIYAPAAVSGPMYDYHTSAISLQGKLTSCIYTANR